MGTQRFLRLTMVLFLPAACYDSGSFSVSFAF